MSFPDTEAFASQLEALTNAAHEAAKRMREQNTLLATFESQIEAGKLALAGEQAANIVARADLADAAKVSQQLRAELEAANRTIATMRDHPDVKAAEEERRKKRLAELRAEQERLEAAAPAG